MAKHVRKTGFARSFWAYSAGITLPILIGYLTLSGCDSRPVQAGTTERVSLDSIKPCDTEDGTRADQTYPCKFDPTARGIFIEGDPGTVIVFYRTEDGCPRTDGDSVCVATPDWSDLGPQNVVRFPDGTVEWTTTRGD
jgi:hypothetical protein